MLINSYRFGDADASAYLAAVEVADGQALESSTRAAVTEFIVGCKADGIWNAIKASCILAGARTLNGALVPLVGAAPTNLNFVAGDYDRKTGLVGDASTKYLITNRNNNADPQNSHHIALFPTTIGNSTAVPSSVGWSNTTGETSIGWAGNIYATINAANWANSSISISSSRNKLIGASRSSVSSFIIRGAAISVGISSTSQTPANGIFNMFRSAYGFNNFRLAFYSIGESLDLALLDARVTTLINAFSTAIP